MLVLKVELLILSSQFVLKIYLSGFFVLMVSYLASGMLILMVWILSFWILSRGWMPLKHALARNLGQWHQHFDDKLQLCQNHWKIIGKTKRSGFCITYSVAVVSICQCDNCLHRPWHDRDSHKKVGLLTHWVAALSTWQLKSSGIRQSKILN
jgi:hypothetical protein